jgi:enoyl-CoA hydratase
MKHLARQGLDQPLNEGLELEQVRISRELLNDDVSEGLAAFEARRPPVFKS